MTVKELIEELKKQDQSMPILFARDEEGNVLHVKADVAVTNVNFDAEKEEQQILSVVIYPLNSTNDII